MSALYFTVLTALVGWIALFPARRRFGAWAYLTLSWPVGLLAWPTTAAACVVLHAPLNLTAALAGGAVFAGVVALGMRWAMRPDPADDRRPVPWWSWLAHLAVIAVVTLAVWKLRVFFVTDDSWFGYEALGTILHDAGILTLQLANSRNLLVPGMHAVQQAVGGELLVVAYPVAALHLASALAIGLWRWSFAGLVPRVRAAATAAVTACLITGNLFLFHAFYIHSHLVTAAFLLIAVLAIVAAREATGTRGLPWLIAGGLATAGVVLARPDGFTYAFIPAALAVAVLLEDAPLAERLSAFFVPLVATTAAAVGAMVAALGVWHAGKLTGPAAIAQVAGLAVLPLVGVALARNERLRNWLTTRNHALRLALGVTAAGTLTALALHPANVGPALLTMGANMYVSGRWGLFWVFAPSIVAVSFAFPSLLRRTAVRHELLYVLGQFFIVALLIHGLTHPGRISPADSFNRIVFHIVPLVWWYAGSFIGSALRDASTSAMLEPAANGGTDSLGRESA